MELHKEKIELVPLSQSNLYFVAETERECFSEPWSERSLEDELSSSNSWFKVAVLGENIVGHIGMYYVCKEGYITNLAVKEKYRRQGIARYLIRSCIEFANENKFKFLTLEVRESNIGAINLYISEGFKKEGVRENFYKNPIEQAMIFTKYFKEKEKDVN